MRQEGFYDGILQGLSQTADAAEKLGKFKWIMGFCF